MLLEKQSLTPGPYVCPNRKWGAGMKTESRCHSLNSTVTASTARLPHLSSQSSLTLASFTLARRGLSLGAGGGGGMVGNVPCLIPTVGSQTMWHYQPHPLGVDSGNVYTSNAVSGKRVDVYLFFPHLRRAGRNSEKNNTNVEWKFWVIVIKKPSGENENTENGAQQAHSQTLLWEP